jgi:hypothetical protein
MRWHDIKQYKMCYIQPSPKSCVNYVKPLYDIKSNFNNREALINNSWFNPKTLDYKDIFILLLLFFIPYKKKNK